MTPQDTPKTALDKARKDLEDTLAKVETLKKQAKARYQAALSREALKQRKADTRRKIILGGALLDLSETNPEAANLLARIVSTLPREQDKAAFKDWTPPKAP